MCVCLRAHTYDIQKGLIGRFSVTLLAIMAELFCDFPQCLQTKASALTSDRLWPSPFKFLHTFQHRLPTSLNSTEPNQRIQRSSRKSLRINSSFKHAVTFNKLLVFERIRFFLPKRGNSYNT